MTITYEPQGVCSRLMQIEVENGVIRSVQVTGGCHGNLQGLGALLRGMRVEEAVARLEGIDCRGKGTSCPDQMALALRRAL
ncbi:MAG: TIGR03905 family TSCPD domain-containing protein [Rikenellaceae bacterium]|nr:TIGR03905 family TSCPD domain-containing protein [Rikenellaceae bacterium]